MALAAVRRPPPRMPIQVTGADHHAFKISKGATYTAHRPQDFPASNDPPLCAVEDEPESQQGEPRHGQDDDADGGKGHSEWQEFRRNANKDSGNDETGKENSDAKPWNLIRAESSCSDANRGRRIVTEWNRRRQISSFVEQD